MPISQDRMKNLVEAALELRRLLVEIKSRAEMVLNDPASDGRLFAAMITETPIPESVAEILAIESTHLKLTYKRNQSNARSLKLRRAARQQEFVDG